MNKTEDFIESKKKENNKKHLIASLKKCYEGEGILDKIFGRKDRLSKENAHIGLILLNQVGKPIGDDNYYHWNRDHIEQDLKRFKTLAKIASPQAFWNEDRYPLLEFIFSDRMAKFVKHAWEMIPSLMYQTGYERRSFRGSDLEGIYFTRQLNFVIDLINEHQYDFSLEEYAIYSNKIYNDNFALLFAAAIDYGDESLKTLLVDTVYLRHEVSKPSRCIIKALLLSKTEECWVAVEKLLLSAQRQEGLRQTILECLDETSLGAMKHLIKVILANKLTRFSSVVRALDTWAGFGWEGERETTVRRILEYADLFLSNPTEIEKSIKSKDNSEVFMALWVQGVMDVNQCFPLLDKILKGNKEKITLALYFVSQVGISTFSLKYGKAYLEHPDPVIVCQAVGLVNDPYFIKTMQEQEKVEWFVKLESQLRIFPKKTVNSKPRVFSWLTFQYGKDNILDMMINLLDLKKESEIDKILPYFEDLSVHYRERVTNLILPEYYGYSYNEQKKKPELTDKKRDFAFSILKDRSSEVKEAGIRALSHANLSGLELQVFEALLTRKAAEYRKSVIGLIIKSGEEQVKESAERLLIAKNEDQRLAGLDLLMWLKSESETNGNWVGEKAREFSKRPVLSSKEEMVLSGLIEKAEDLDAFTAQNGFGLFNPKNIPNGIAPDVSTTIVYAEAIQEQKYGLSMPADKINAALEDLNDLILKHQDFEYSCEDWNGTITSVLLGNTFQPIKRDVPNMTPEEMLSNIPLLEVWEKWFLESGLTSRDLFLINLNANIELKRDIGGVFYDFNKNLLQKVFVPEIPKLKNYHYWNNPFFILFKSFEALQPYEEKIEFLSGLVSDVFSYVEKNITFSYKEVKTSWQTQVVSWRDISMISNIWGAYQSTEKDMSKVQFAKFWKFAQWIYFSVPVHPKQNRDYLPSLHLYCRAFTEDLISKDILYWRIMREDAINLLTTTKKKDEYDLKEDYPFLNEMIEECKERILKIELVRGDSSTEVTKLAQNINKIEGIENFVQLLKALGKDNLHRGYLYKWGGHEYNRKEMLSNLLKNCFPSPSCDQKQFNTLVKSAKIQEKRLCEASAYAPQWLPFVSNYLGWKNMESAVWWLHAHTNGYHDVQTESEIAKYSAVEIPAFREGAVDIAWFRESYQSLGQQKWKKLYDSAKYICDGGGHRRGLLYADVILKKVKITEITNRITSKRNQDYLRVYGVVPLSKTNPEKDVLKRYQFLQQFKKESKQFGSQRQASESTAVRIAMENLARTAGYSDPIRLQWAMETKEAQSILENAKDVWVEDLQISLEIDEHGKSSIYGIKEGKKLKSIPPKVRKDKEYLKLKKFNQTLRTQYRRTRKSLEMAMVNADLFSKSEVETLYTHPVVAPMLKKLVLISDENFGFLNEKGLVSLQGDVFPIGEEIRIAHCVDLYQKKQWGAYQQNCFKQNLVQPFKQIFRELYVPTGDELKEKNISRRYAGNQIQPKKAIALLKGQNWTVDYSEGLQKVNFKQNIIARMFAMADWFSPADVEAPTIETVEFMDRNNGKTLPFVSVDKLVFSETMRDIDLAISVAHVGEVDPEASQSSIQLRSVIVEETCRLFKLENVVLSDNHAKIKGDLGNYSVHLGSGVCHKMAGTSLSIIPVHSQHRGRMFLPFIDDDPKTAEIVSKVLLLAKDKKISDPTILRQI